ncbi:MAG: aminopeptidase [Bacilli bacterium]|jgi:aminopeptidase|nr:aminopeptidase [Bacilli bacterium]MCH4210180.1 aminopeptidase [Bacilli bacterium]MCH4277819.1 aminopeptidase [Bacilli bacterium]
MKKSLLKEYAKLIVYSGAAVKKGQYVIIRTNVSQEKFAAIVAKECYKAGAKRVIMSWESFALSQVDYKYGKSKNIGTLSPMEMAFQQFSTDALPVLIWLDSDDPDGLKGIDAKKVAEIKAMRHAQAASLIEARDNKYQWCIAGCPGEEWAKKVFPNLSRSKAMESLWNAILLTSRALDGNGIENWKKHDEILKEKCDYLNSLNLRSLHYAAKNGTDLKVGLIPGVIFLGGGEKTIDGTYFEPNIPSEECFTSPMKGQAEGIVYASKPLAYNGQLIENFYVRFHEGKAVEVHAEKGQEALESIISLDEGASYLGECALVPFDSPINQTGLLFYNTLYDENACCHLALGRGFTELFPHFEQYSDEELRSFGINKSLSHVDFMIGTNDLSIIGTDDKGKEIVLFKNGTWAF